jgi:uncharacterized OB-fold protein
MLTVPFPTDALSLAMDRWTEPFWQGCREHRLLVPQCTGCGTYRMPPTPWCPSCHSPEVRWVAQSGRGILYSYTLCTLRASETTPSGLYAPAIVELPDAAPVRLISDVVGADPEKLVIGMELRLDWQAARDGWQVPYFRPAQS